MYGHVKNERIFLISTEFSYFTMGGSYFLPASTVYSFAFLFLVKIVCFVFNING